MKMTKNSITLKPSYPTLSRVVRSLISISTSPQQLIALAQVTPTLRIQRLNSMQLNPPFKIDFAMGKCLWLQHRMNGDWHNLAYQPLQHPPSSWPMIHLNFVHYHLQYLQHHPLIYNAHPFGQKKHLLPQLNAQTAIKRGYLSDQSELPINHYWQCHHK